MAITPAPGPAATEPDREPSDPSPALDGAQVQPAASEAYRSQAGRYDRRTEAFQPWRERLVERLPARPGDTVLDVGCGTGLCLPLLHDKVGPTGTIVGIDASEQMLQVAADRVTAHGWDNVRLVAAPAEQAPIDGPADAALFCAVHDVLQSRAALGRVFRSSASRRGGGRGRREIAGTVAAAPARVGPRPARTVRRRFHRLRQAVATAGRVRPRPAGPRTRLRRRIPGLRPLRPGNAVTTGPACPQRGMSAGVRAGSFEPAPGSAADARAHRDGDHAGSVARAQACGRSG